MKRIYFLIVFVVAAVAIHAQNTNATLLQPAGSYLYYGDQVMNKKECMEFLSTRHQPAYETFKSGYKCTQAAWGLFGAGVGVDVVGTVLMTFGLEGKNDAMFFSGASCVIAGGLAVIASIPTIFIGYARLNKGIDMFNMSQAAATSQAYWTVQGSQDGLGLALHF